MKNSILISILLALFTLWGCSKEDINNASAAGKTIPVTITATQDEIPQTRTEYDDTDPLKLIVKWKSDRSDLIGVFASNSNSNNNPFSVSGELRDNGKQADFTGTISSISLDDPMTVYAYCPHHIEQTNRKAIGIDLSQQVQVGVGTTDHLAGCDLMAAVPITYNRLSDIGDNILMKFKPLCTVMSFDVVNPSSTKPLTVAVVELFTEGSAIFNNYATVDITNPAFPMAFTSASESIFLNVSGNKEIAPGATGRFSMMMFPMTDGLPVTLKAAVYTSSGTYYQEKPVPTGGFERGRRYLMKLDRLEEDNRGSLITLDKQTMDLVVGDTKKLSATITPTDALDKRIKWEVDDPSLLEINSVTGVMKAIAIGTTKVTATSSTRIKTSCTVNIISAPVPVTSIALNKTATTMGLGRSETLTATITPANATNQEVTWSSSNQSVASVSNGVITTHKAGSVTITVTTAEGNKTATCVVTVSDAIAAVGDYYYSDGTFSTVYESPKPCIGIVFWIDPTDASHGKIVSLDETKGYCGAPVDESATVAGIRSADDGATATRNLIAARKDSPNFTTEYHAFNWIYTTKNKSNINGRWYLPAKMELRQLYAAMSGARWIPMGSTAGDGEIADWDDYKNAFADESYRDVRKAFNAKFTVPGVGGTGMGIQADRTIDRFYWSSTENDNDNTWSLDFTTGRTDIGAKSENLLPTRAISAF